MVEKPTYKELEKRIQELERIESKYKQTEEQHRLFSDNAIDAFYLSDMDGRFLDANKAACATLGYTHEEMLAMTISDVDTNFHLDKLSEILESLHHNEPRLVKSSHKKKNGEIFPVDVWIRSFGPKEQPLLVSFARDVTEGKRTEEALRQGKEFADSLIDTAPVIVLVLDSDGRIIRFNPYMEKISGYKFEEVKGKDWFNIFLPGKDHDRMRELFKRAVSDIQTLGNINPILNRDGREILIEWNDKTLKDKEGKVVGLLAIGQDITERKQAEKEIKNNAENLKTIFNSTPNILVLVNGETRVEMINNSGAAFLGKKKEVLFGLLGGEVFNCLNSFDGEGCGRNPDCSQCPVRTRVMSTFQTGKPHSGEEGQMTFLLNDEEISMDLLISTTLLKLGGAPKVLLSLIDITERKQAIEDLRKSENNYKALAENPNSIVMRFDPKGNIFFVNQYACQLFGYSFKEMMGKKSTDLIHPGIQDDGQSAEDLFAKLLNHPERFQTNENANLTKDGKRLWISWTNTPTYDESGQLTGLICTGFDTTDKKQMETQLQQSQKMESIGTLAGGIAHDFNNILFPIVGHTEMLIEDVPENSPFRESLNEIYTGAMRARGLVKQILTFSRQNNSELKLMKMQPIIKEALKLIRSTIPTTIKIKQNIQTDCGVIKADPTQIHQIIMNLSTNAFHAMEDTGGELIVSLKERELGALDLINPNMIPGVYACLIVADTGKGMNKDLIGKIFDPFFTTKAIGKGTGMGLSVIHGIVVSLKGAIQVYSESGEGTQFHVYLPVEKSLPEKQVTNSKTKIQGGTEQILLVDDEKAILTMEKMMLERLGYQVTSRTSSIEALEAFREGSDKFDIVITDMAMPNMSGDKLSAELTKIRPDIPILLCSGFSETMSEEKAESLGIKGFLWKPIVMKDLAKKIRDVLEKNPKEIIGK